MHSLSKRSTCRDIFNLSVWHSAEYVGCTTAVCAFVVEFNFATKNSCFYLWVHLIIKLLRSDPSPHQVISHGVGQGKVIIPWRCNVSVFHQSEVQVSIKALLQLCHVLHSHDPPDTDLLALLLVGERCRHGGCAVSGLRNRACPGLKVKLNGKRVAVFMH